MTTFDADIVAAVIRHMNEDHPDDNLLVVRAFGDIDADSAVMTGLDGSAGVWSYTSGSDTHEVAVAWSQQISERAEIRREVVVLYEAACAKLGIVPRSHE
ncbi:MAG: DUF2470 domain-containing protein [Terrimesophilobacter sp.]